MRYCGREEKKNQQKIPEHNNQKIMQNQTHSETKVVLVHVVYNTTSL